MIYYSTDKEQMDRYVTLYHVETGKPMTLTYRQWQKVFEDDDKHGRPHLFHEKETIEPPGENNAEE